MASPILLTTSADLAEQVARRGDGAIARLSRQAIALAAFENNGGIVVVPDLARAVDWRTTTRRNTFACSSATPGRWSSAVRNAGGVFLGEASAEVMGDYVAGPSHTMPTSGAARVFSPLNVEEFLKIDQPLRPQRPRPPDLGPAAITLAEAESLTAHAAAVRRRLGND